MYATGHAMTLGLSDLDLLNVLDLEHDLEIRFQ